jgi:transposase
MGVPNPRKYTDDFKHRAVDLAREIGPCEAARKLGISNGNIYQWRKKLARLGRVSKSDTKSPTESVEDQLRRLQKENSELKKANLILKSAAAFFSQDHLK